VGATDSSKPPDREIIGQKPEWMLRTKYLLEKVEIFAMFAADGGACQLPVEDGRKEVVFSPAGMVLVTYKESLPISS
jgi:hypothetical protein